MVLEKLKNNQNVISNFGYLSLLQMFNLVLPIVTYPYLIRVLGKEIYGQIIYAQAIIGYFVILINFGFNITATKEISINRNRQSKINQIVSSVYLIKGTLFLASLFILITFLYFTDAKNSTYNLYILTMWLCLHEFLFPIWYFQGIEKMKYITFLSVTSRVFFLILIFLLIKTESDYLMVPIINGIGACISCLIALTILRKNNIKFTFQRVRVLLYYLNKSYIMAFAYGANAFKTNLNIIVIKYFFSFSAVAYFDLALKVTNIGISFLDLISQSIYPKMSKEKNVSFFKSVLKGATIFSIICMFLVQLLAVQIVEILGGISMDEASKILVILACIFPIYITGALLGRNCLIIHGFDLFVLKSMVFSSLVYLLLVFIYKLFFVDMESTWMAGIFILSFLFESIYRYKKCYDLRLI